MKQKNSKTPSSAPNGRPGAFKSAVAKKAKSSENPFDKFSNAKKKHDVLNRRVKGEDRNVGRARAKAVDERKNKLLKDYQSNKKSNSFLDKRFGESDANLSLEEKMFMRFQQERVKKVRNGSLFNLDSNDTEVLTHKGQQLGDSNIDDHDWVSSDEEGGGKLDKDVVNKLHFGGGMVEAKNSSKGVYGPGDEEEDAAGPRKGRLEALQEIVMKSKLHKMQRKEAKEEQEDERDKLDKAFDSLFATSQIDIVKPEKGRRSRAEDVDGCDGNDAYDVSLREMAFEGKAQPSDRTKTAEELALEARERVEELEKARIRRMKHVADPLGEDKEAAAALKGHRNIRGRSVAHVTDDMIDMPAPKERGAAASAQSEDEDEEEDDEDDDEDEEDEDEGDEDEEYSDDDDEEGDEEEEDERPDYDEQPEAPEEDDSEGGSSDEDSEDGLIRKGTSSSGGGGGKASYEQAKRKKQRLALLSVDDGVNIALPHKIACPASIEAFDELVDQFVRSDADMRALIDRIITWNSVHLPGPQGAENRNLMHNFVDVLLKHFVRVGDSLGRSENAEADVQTQLDHLSSTIFTLCQTVGDACSALWGRTLKIMQSQLQKRLRDYAVGNRESCWPSLGRLLLLQLLGHVFSVTDLRNDIVGPAALFLCQCLAQCPVASAKDVASGMLTCNVLLAYTAETRRFVPEVMMFLHSTAALYLPEGAVVKQRLQSTINFHSLDWLRGAAARDSSTSSSSRIPWSCFSVSAAGQKLAEIQLSSGILSTLYVLVDAVLRRYDTNSAVSELFDPILTTLRAIRPQDSPSLPKASQQAHLELVEKIIAECARQKHSRVPLQWRRDVTMSIDMKAPRFQLDYTFKKDTDPDEDRVKLKQLNRQFKREKKAAMRELRRDSDYIDQERYKEVTAAKEKRRAERVRNFGWMEEQAATVNQQVRQGEGLMKGGGSNIAKKARVKRM